MRRIFVHADGDVNTLMLDRIIALVPALAAGIYFFGIRAAVLAAVSAAAAAAAEMIYLRLVSKTEIKDLSSVLTGLMLGLCLPSEAPVWMAVVGGVIAVIAFKMIFGGLGKSLFNETAAACCVLLLVSRCLSAIFGISSGEAENTVLQMMSGGATRMLPKPAEAFLGMQSGGVGTVSCAAVITGFVYLALRRAVSVKPVLMFTAVFGILTYLFGRNGAVDSITYTLLQIFSGNFLFVACFMVTDYTTTPVTSGGRLIGAALCGAIAFLIRKYCAYEQGIFFAVLVMNALTPFIDKWAVPRPYGVKKRSM